MSVEVASVDKDQKIGFVYAFFAAIAYASMAFVAKLAVEVSPSTMVFFRNFICFLILIPVFLRNRNFKTEKIPLFALRAVLGYSCLCCFYYGTKHLKVVDSVLLINTAPLFIPIVILFWDRVKISKSSFFAIVLGFLGILFILKPRFDFFNFSGIIGLGAGIFMAGSMVTLRKLSKTEPTERILFYFFSGNMVIGFFPMILSWKRFEDPMMWVYLFLTSLFGYFFQYLTTKAYTYVSASRVSVMSYLAIVFSSIYGWLFWNNIPDFTFLIGTILVILGGVLVVGKRVA